MLTLVHYQKPYFVDLTPREHPSLTKSSTNYPNMLKLAGLASAFSIDVYQDIPQALVVCEMILRRLGKAYSTGTVGYFGSKIMK